MGLTVNGNIIVKGDQLFDNAVKIVKGDAKKNDEPLTDDRLKEQIEFVRNRIENGRMWFPVCKYIMWRKRAAEGDFDSAVALIEGLFPEAHLNKKDLSSLNVLSFRKELKDWDENDCPIKDRTTFYKYRDLAELLMEM